MRSNHGPFGLVIHVSSGAGLTGKRLLCEGAAIAPLSKVCSRQRFRQWAIAWMGVQRYAGEHALSRLRPSPLALQTLVVQPKLFWVESFLEQFNVSESRIRKNPFDPLGIRIADITAEEYFSNI